MRKFYQAKICFRFSVIYAREPVSGDLLSYLHFSSEIWKQKIALYKQSLVTALFIWYNNPIQNDRFYNPRYYSVILLLYLLSNNFWYHSHLDVTAKFSQ